MPTITFVTADGREYPVIADIGKSVMETALEKNVPGIVAECNGSAACATCHAYFEPSFLPMLGSVGEHESDMLDFTAAPRFAGSRLSCQVKISAGFDGMTVRIPPLQ